jgi:Na+/H+ antiporter NhaD/arsenite permease-like protein
MIMVRIVAVLVLAALVLIIAYFVTRKRRYLTWAWRTFIAALVCMLGVMTFYFVERLFLGA